MERESPTLTISGAEREQNNFNDIIRILKVYKPKTDPKYYKLKQDLLINAQNFYDGREMIIETFKNKLFPLSKPCYYPGYVSEEDISLPKSNISSDSEDELLKQYDELYKAISNVDNKLDFEIVRKYFNKGSLLELFKFLRYAQNKATGGSKQDLIEVNLSDLEKDIRNMSGDEIKNKNLDLIAYFVEKILDTVKKINNQEQQPDTTDMPELEDEESAAERQQIQGLKTLTQQQMIARLLVLLAHLKAGNNSQKIKNEIRQLLYSLYRSKNLNKTIYNSLMDTI